ncbi:MAG: murein biosynthesis integral membrane protein MurJ [Anaerolineaceae bacterium]|nr:murein biosynthesis integral membrane protein MurJ [Anaerolineaceae bacterium]
MPEPTDQTTIGKGRGFRQIAGSTLIVMIAFAAAKLLSLVQTVVITQNFGLSDEWDAFVAANRIPELIFTLIAGGALSHAFIPIFSGLLTRDETQHAWRTASHIINSIFVVTFCISLLVFIFAPWLVTHVVASGFEARWQSETATLMRILLLGTLIFSVSGIVMGILQSHQHFTLPALAPLCFDAGILFGVLVLAPRWGARGIATGAVIGAAAHLWIQVPGLIHYRARWWPQLGWRDPLLWRVVRLMLPRVAGLGVFSLNFLIMTNLASRLGSGSVSALDWGWRLMQIPQTLLGTALGTVIFPTLAALNERGDQEGKRSSFAGSLRMLIVTCIPATAGLLIIGQPLLSLLERGAFDASATQLVYFCLQFFALGLLAHAALEVVARSFYAEQDTLTPLWAALLGAALNLFLALWLSGVLLGRPNQQRVGGLALANTLGVILEVTLLLWWLRRRWRDIGQRELWQSTRCATLATLVMAAALWLSHTLWHAAIPRNLGSNLALVGVQCLLGLSVYLFTAWRLGMQELRELITLWPGRSPAHMEKESKP